MNKYLLLLFFPLFIVACKPNLNEINNNAFGIWKFSDVRLLDPVDTINPEQDLISVYTRTNERYFQIRLDFLDLQNTDGRDIYIPIDTNPGGIDRMSIREIDFQNINIPWDYLIIFRSDGDIKIVSSDYQIVANVELLIFIDSVQDNFVFSINQNSIPITPLTTLQVLITSPSKDKIVDKTSSILLDSSPTTKPKIQFIFWNTMDTSTPAEALRSWAGAHSGPISSRHGLKYLLDATLKYEYPLLILDFCKPLSLSILDYLSAIDQIRLLWEKDLLKVCNHENMDSSIFYLLKDNFYNNVVFGYDYAQYIKKINNESIFSGFLSISKGDFLVALLQFKSQIISSAITGLPTPLVLGNDFRVSYLGDPANLEFFYSYIYNHPWIQVDDNFDIDPFSLNQFELSEGDRSDLSIEQNIQKSLHNSPDNLITDLAWQVYSTLLDPGTEVSVPLGSEYIAQIGQLLAASNWVNKPSQITSCSIDLDFDGDNECILSSENIFLTIEPMGGYIPFIFSIDQNGVHQIVGPTWEFIVGLSDITEWDLSKGVKSDPKQILGAFYNYDEEWETYNTFIRDNYIEIQNEDMSIRKFFAIDGNIIEITYQVSGNQNGKI